MPEDKLLGFYNTLKESGAVEGLPADYGKFKNGLSNPENAEGFYNTLKESGAVEGLPNDFNTFSTALGLSKGEPTVQSVMQGYGGLGKPSVNPQSASGLASQQQSGLTPQAQSVPPTPSQPSEVQQTSTSGQPDFGFKGIVERVGKETPTSKANEVIASLNKGQKEDTSLGEDLVNSFLRGSAQLGQSLAETPAFIYDIAAMPQNYIADKFDIPALKASSEETGKMLGIENNAVADYYRKQVEASQSKFQEKYDKGITDYFSKGDYSKGFGLLANQIAESAPVTISLMMGNAAGVGTAGSISGSGLVFGADKKAQLDRDAPWMSEQEKATAAMMYGLSEGLFEQFGLTKIGGVVSNVLKQSGKEEAKRIAKEGFKESYGKILRQYFGTMTEEALSEAATQYSQNAIAKYSGEKPDQDLTEGVADAFIVGLGASSIYGTAPTIAQVAKTKKGIEEQKKIQEEKAQITQSIESPELPDAVKGTLAQKLKELNEKEANIVIADSEVYNELPDAQKKQVDVLQSDAEQITQALSDPNLTPDAKTVLEEKVAQIEDEKDAILEKKEIQPSNTTTNNERQSNNQQEAGSSQEGAAASEVGNGESRTAEEVKQGAEQAPTSGAIKVASESVSVEAKPSPIDKQGIIASQKWIKDLYSLPDLTRIQDKNGNTYDIKGGKVRKLTLDNNGSIVDAEVIHTDRSIHERGAFSNPDFFNEGYVVLKDPLQSIKTPTNESTKVESVQQAEPNQEGVQSGVGNGTQRESQDSAGQQEGKDKGKVPARIPTVIFHATDAKFEGLPKKIAGGKTGNFNEPAGVYYSVNAKTAQQATGKQGSQRVVEAEFKPKNPLVIDSDLTDETYNAALQKAEADVRAQLGEDEYMVREEGQDPELGQMVSDAFAKNLTEQGFDAVINKRNGDVIVLDESVVAEKAPRKLTPDQETRQATRQLLQDASEWSKIPAGKRGSPESVSKMVELRKRGAKLGLKQEFEASKKGAGKMVFINDKGKSVKLEGVKKIADDSETIWSNENYTAQQGDNKVEFYDNAGDQIDARSDEYKKARAEYVRSNAREFLGNGEAVDIDDAWNRASDEYDFMQRFADAVVSSDNAFEIAANYDVIKQQDENLGEQQEDATRRIGMAFSKINESDFNRYFDKNWIPKDSKWIDKTNSQVPLDSQIQEAIGEQSEMKEFLGNKDEQDVLNVIGDIIQQYPNGAQSIPTSQKGVNLSRASEKFKEITGLDLNPQTVAEFAKVEQALSEGKLDSDLSWNNLSPEEKQQLLDEQERIFTPNEAANKTAEGFRSETSKGKGGGFIIKKPTAESENIVAEIDAVFEKKGQNFKAQKSKFESKYGDKAKQAVDINRNFEKYKDQLMDAGIIKKIEC